jgi:HAD superfamily hydrolase (TIGR01549 family)
MNSSSDRIDDRKKLCSIDICGKQYHYSAIVFDLDGTLYDKDPIKWYMLKRFFPDIFRLYKYIKFRKTLIGKDFQSAEQLREYTLKTLAENNTNKQQNWNDWLENKYYPVLMQCFQEKLEAYPNINKLLHHLDQANLEMIVISDYRQVQERLNILKIETKYFKLMQGTEELGAMKPAQKIIDLILTTINHPPEQILVIGDRYDTDMKMAELGGMLFLGVTKKEVKYSGEWLKWTALYNKLMQTVT